MTRTGSGGEDAGAGRRGRYDVAVVLPRPHAVLLDLDGTLLDTLDDVSGALGRALGRHGYDVPTREQVARMVGDGARTLVARSLEQLGVVEAAGNGQSGSEIDRVLATFSEEYAAHPVTTTHPCRGALELLDALARARIPAVVCTNKRGALARRIVEQTLGGRVAATVGAGDAPKLKPAPDLLLAGLVASGASGPAWMVGDSAQDVLAARAAGITAIALRNGYGDPARLAAAGADLLIDDLAALLPLL
jgi:phosphoglycolate phosphatase